MILPESNYVFFCTECNAEHPREWLNAEGCVVADAFYQQNIESKSMDTTVQWVRFARDLIFNDVKPRATYTVTHHCGCVTTEYSATPMIACYGCLQQRVNDRYDN